jgi:hypothetical protein
MCVCVCVEKWQGTMVYMAFSFPLLSQHHHTFFFFSFFPHHDVLLQAMNFPQNYHSTLPALKANYIIFRNVEHSPKKKKILVKEQNFVIEKY